MWTYPCGGIAASHRRSPLSPARARRVSGCLIDPRPPMPLAQRPRSGNSRRRRRGPQSWAGRLLRPRAQARHDGGAAEAALTDARALVVARIADVLDSAADVRRAMRGSWCAFGTAAQVGGNAEENPQHVDEGGGGGNKGLES